MCQISNGQTKSFIDQPYLETTAKVDTLIKPDIIYLGILVREKDERNKISVEEMETRMIAKLKSIGIDPIQFGIIMVLNLCIGLCTPPVGSVLFVGVGIAKTSIEKVIKPLFPLFIAMIFALGLITYFPQITLWLPGKFGF